MPERTRTFTIGVLANEAGVHVETIRFYQLKKLMVAPPKHYGSARRYQDADVARVRFIKAAQGIGFNLTEVAELLRLDDGTHCREAAEMATRKLMDVRERLKRLRQMERALSQLLTACHTQGGQVSCPLIQALKPDPASD